MNTQIETPTATPTTPAPAPAPVFIKPEHGFYFLGSKVMKDGKKRSYLVSVTKSGNLTAYVTHDFEGRETPVYENLIPLVIKRKLINSIPMAIDKLGLSTDIAKLDTKDFRTLEIGYLESIKLPSLKQLKSINLTDTEITKLSELSDAYRKINNRNSVVFAAYIRELIKSRSK